MEEPATQATATGQPSQPEERASAALVSEAPPLALTKTASEWPKAYFPNKTLPEGEKNRFAAIIKKLNTVTRWQWFAKGTRNGTPCLTASAQCSEQTARLLCEAFARSDVLITDESQESLNLRYFEKKPKEPKKPSSYSFILPAAQISDDQIQIALETYKIFSFALQSNECNHDQRCRLNFPPPSGSPSDLDAILRETPDDLVKKIWESLLNHLKIPYVDQAKLDQLLYPLPELKERTLGSASWMLHLTPNKTKKLEQIVRALTKLCNTVNVNVPGIIANRNMEELAQWLDQELYPGTVTYQKSTGLYQFRTKLSTRTQEECNAVIDSCHQLCTGRKIKLPIEIGPGKIEKDGKTHIKVTIDYAEESSPPYPLTETAEQQQALDLLRQTLAEELTPIPDAFGEIPFDALTPAAFESLKILAGIMPDKVQIDTAEQKVFVEVVNTPSLLGLFDLLFLLQTQPALPNRAIAALVSKWQDTLPLNRNHENYDLNLIDTSLGEVNLTTSNDTNKKSTAHERFVFFLIDPTQNSWELILVRVEPPEKTHTSQKKRKGRRKTHEPTSVQKQTIIYCRFGATEKTDSAKHILKKLGQTPGLTSSYSELLLEEAGNPMLLFLAASSLVYQPREKFTIDTLEEQLKPFNQNQAMSEAYCIAEDQTEAFKKLVCNELLRKAHHRPDPIELKTAPPPLELEKGAPQEYQYESSEPQSNANQQAITEMLNTETPWKTWRYQAGNGESAGCWVCTVEAPDEDVLAVFIAAFCDERIMPKAATGEPLNPRYNENSSSIILPGAWTQEAITQALEHYNQRPWIFAITPYQHIVSTLKLDPPSSVAETQRNDYITALHEVIFKDTQTPHLLARDLAQFLHCDPRLLALINSTDNAGAIPVSLVALPIAATKVLSALSHFMAQLEMMDGASLQAIENFRALAAWLSAERKYEWQTNEEDHLELTLLIEKNKNYQPLTNAIGTEFDAWKAQEKVQGILHLAVRETSLTLTFKCASSPEAQANLQARLDAIIAQVDLDNYPNIQLNYYLPETTGPFRDLIVSWIKAGAAVYKNGRLTLINPLPIIEELINDISHIPLSVKTEQPIPPQTFLPPPTVLEGSQESWPEAYQYQGEAISPENSPARLAQIVEQLNAAQGNWCLYKAADGGYYAVKRDENPSDERKEKAKATAQAFAHTTAVAVEQGKTYNMRYAEEGRNCVLILPLKDAFSEQPRGPIVTCLMIHQFLQDAATCQGATTLPLCGTESSWYEENPLQSLQSLQRNPLIELRLSVFGRIDPSITLIYGCEAFGAYDLPDQNTLQQKNTCTVSLPPHILTQITRAIDPIVSILGFVLQDPMKNMNNVDITGLEKINNWLEQTLVSQSDETASEHEEHRLEDLTSVITFPYAILREALQSKLSEIAGSQPRLITVDPEGDVVINNIEAVLPLMQEEADRFKTSAHALTQPGQGLYQSASSRSRPTSETKPTDFDLDPYAQFELKKPLSFGQ